MEIRSVLRNAGTAVLGAALVFGTQVVSAAWPDKSVRMIVPFGTGGGTDIQARLLANNLRMQTGQTFVVDNRSGAGGLIGAELVVKSRNDGYTLLFTTATLAINTTLYSKTLKFNPRTDLVPASWVSNAPNVLCVHPNVPAKSVKELVALAKQRPGMLNNGVNTPGSTSHLAGELFAQQANIKTVIIPYTGGGPAMAGLITGDIDLLFATGPVAARALKTGRVRCLGVTTPERNRSLPDLPAIKTVVPGVEIGNWYSMFFPKGTPSDIVNKMSGMVKKALSDKKIDGFFAREGIVAVGGSPTELRAQFEADVKKYGALIKARNIPLR
ncbi:MAG: tripartite tricarboxylate transporter substrate-binding protein [Betaproteobacteria bacterium]|nr:tripartite tricarboxylate transporter substrate-binding protein [Betaproteobacteria bacterium]MDH3437589.1 tripartite tricarboxylate transporter substrate-binding protein [Betaproteobacteria bacterium]